MSQDLQPGGRAFAPLPSQAEQAAAIVTGVLAGEAAVRLLGPFGSLESEVATHEAAHAVCHYLNGCPATRLSVRPPAGAPAWVGGFTSGSREGQEPAFVSGRGMLSSDQRLGLLFLRLGSPEAGWKQIRSSYRACKELAEMLVSERAFEVAMLGASFLKAGGELDGPAIKAAIEQAIRGRDRLEFEAVIHFAGAAAARRSLRGSEAGWRRFRTPDELRSFHECGHAVAQWALGLHVWRLSIVIDEGVRSGRTGFSGGYAAAGETPDPPGSIERPARVETDLRQAARACWTLGSPVPPFGLRGALRVAHRLRRRAAELVGEHWERIALLAARLVEHRELEAGEIARILGPPLEGRNT